MESRRSLLVCDLLPLSQRVLSRVSMLIYAERDTVMANPSVRLSVTLWYCMETNEHFVKLFPTYGRGMILVFFVATVVRKF